MTVGVSKNWLLSIRNAAMQHLLLSQCHQKFPYPQRNGYIDAAGLKPRLQNALRRVAAYSNPEFYKKKALGFSTRNIPRIVFCGEDVGSYIHLPRGCQDQLTAQLAAAEIPYTISDER